MPHGSIKSRQNNKKTNRKGGGNVRTVPPTTASSSSSFSIHSNVTVNFCDDIHDVVQGKNQEQEFSPTSSSIYSRYKHATEQFKQSLLQLVPSSTFSSSSVKSSCTSTTTNVTSTGTKELLDAVDYIYSQVTVYESSNFVSSRSSIEKEKSNVMKPLYHPCNGDDTFSAGATATEEENVAVLHINKIVIDPQIMVDLKTAISIRKRVMKTFYENGDQGHQYFYSVLLYCWNTLKRVISLQKLNAPEEKGKENSISNRFTALSINDTLDDSDLNDDEDVSISPSHEKYRQRPIPTTAFEEYDDGLFMVRALLCSIDEMMGLISKVYEEIKMIRQEGANPDNSHICMKHMIRGAIMVNYCLQQVRILETDIFLQYPYYTTVYRMLIPVLSSKYVDCKMFTDVILSNIPSSLQMCYTTGDTIAFHGDLLEAGFRNPADVRSKSEQIISAFCTKWNISSSVISDDVIALCKIGSVEAPFIYCETKRREYMNRLQAFGLMSHQFLRQFKFIGGPDRSIIHTIRLVQYIGHESRKGLVPEINRSYFGKEWDERCHPGSKITYCMDGLLMYDILPTLISNCKGGALASNLPREKELLTFFNVLKSFTSSPDEPVSWSVAFAIHALLTSVFELKGNDDIKELKETAKSCCNTYIEQLDSILTNEESIHSSKIPKAWINQVKSIKYVTRWLITPAFFWKKGFTPSDGRPSLDTVFDRAFWNPLCSGLFMQYICYHTNLERGFSQLNSCAQLSMVLHLYNAFIQAGALKNGDIEFLDWLYNTFKNSKSIWEGPIPVKGEYVKRIFITMGLPIKMAQRHANRAHTQSLQRMQPLHNGPRKVPVMSPKGISISYSRLCLNDFSYVDDRRHVNICEAGMGITSNEIVARCNDTFYNFSREERLIATNCILMGYQLYQFIKLLADELEWTPIFETIGEAKYRLPAMLDHMTKELLGRLDVKSNCIELSSVETDPSHCVSRAAAFFISYFKNQFQEKELSFFSPLFIEEETEVPYRT